MPLLNSYCSNTQLTPPYNFVFSDETQTEQLVNVYYDFKIIYEQLKLQLKTFLLGACSNSAS